jgi:outer membrane murein-binding lipoprotein Lpp
MKKILLATALCGTLVLGACASVQTALNNLPAQITTVTSETQAIATAVCAFEPTAATISGVVAALFPAGGPINTVATGVAQAICNAVTAKSGKYGGSAPMVAGVLIEGHFVTKAHSLAVKHKLEINGVQIEGHFVR